MGSAEGWAGKGSTTEACEGRGVDDIHSAHIAMFGLFPQFVVQFVVLRCS